MPAPATVSVRRDAVTQITIERSPVRPTAADGEHKDDPAWHPVSEQGLLAALATLAAAH